jgi:hypothetical protein
MRYLTWPPPLPRLFFFGKSRLVTEKQGRCAQKASAEKEFHPEIPPGFGRRAYRAPAGRPYTAITEIRCTLGGFGEKRREGSKYSKIFSQLIFPGRGGLRFFSFRRTKFDELVKSQKPGFSVIPAEAGIQLFQGVLDPGFRRGDDPRDFLRDHQIWQMRIWSCHFEPKMLFKIID